ncbi:conserved hypothetical protein [Halorhabdus utahensis DSM 12940]|uniref:CHAT domain-containing protein n=1 Tax=Halorhabdus utahensis (strain DSM 12940 / JCM 11049 / AX-2) TaxID=519442 RepID=C7NTB2_HALUD|nr:hypothetical protein [Halorhabdus utahensis]ACV10834.1 conserved hypothetical protein [Halorhabdus utahensis DSM 12940]
METLPLSSTPRFEPLAAPTGIQVVDPIDGGQFTFLTPDPVETDPAPKDALPVPVDGAVSIDTDVIRTPYLVGVWIRDGEFDLVEQCTGGDQVSLPDGRYVVEFSSVQLKLYLGIDGPATVDATGDLVEFSTSGESDVVVGLRSYHEQPARTITTTESPHDVMKAISQFRGALKTTSPERSFPTLRGHPPLVEFGEEFSAPGGARLSPASLSIELPPRWDRILPAAPLSYYLDADLVPGDRARLHLDGETVPLVGPDGYEQRIAQILKHVFTLDCVVRTEGLYNVDLHERSVLEARTDLDFQRLYDLPLAERTLAYLDVPFETVEPATPEWKLTADVQPEPENARVLPFLSSDLALIRATGDDDIEPEDLSEASPDVESFFRDGPAMPDEPVLLRGAADVRSGTSSGESEVAERVFRPDPTDSLMHTFVGDGIPLGATKMTPEMFRRRLEYEPVESGRVRVDVIVNEEAMSDETAVSDVYGTRDWIDFDVTIHSDLTQGELADVFQRDTDFLHYIGHVDDEGFKCSDGYLDVRSLSSVNISGFLLNACQSYVQGRALVDAGAVGGIVTLANIPNPTATSIGKTLARLLNSGFSIATARSFLEKDEQLAKRYMVVGDGYSNIVESQSGAPYYIEIEGNTRTPIMFSIQGYPSPSLSIGGLRSWHSKSFGYDYINPTRIEEMEMSKHEFDEFLSREDYPIFINDELTWSDDFQID